jgi:hypothetical protein
MRRRGFLRVGTGALFLAAAAFAGGADASNLIDRNATAVRLVVTKDGAAHLLYSARGKFQHVVAYGGINAEFPNPAKKQVALKLNYSGGWGTRYYVRDPDRLVDTCAKYDGPALYWAIAACKAPDGSYWVAQNWQRMLPNHGIPPNADTGVWELRLSHWKGPLPALTVKTDWAYAGRWEHLYGSLTYLGRPMYGFHTTRYGAPTDNWGVLLYLDTLDSRYGKGWQRAESFVTHNPTGIFCYVQGPHNDGTPTGAGYRYRITAVGPGVLPDVVWLGNPPGAYDKARDEQANEEQRQSYSDKACRPN